jgi:hypothetical protein
MRLTKVSSTAVLIRLCLVIFENIKKKLANICERDDFASCFELANIFISKGREEYCLKHARTTMIKDNSILELM